MTLTEPRAALRRTLRPLAGRPSRGDVRRDVLLGAVIAAQCAVEIVLRHHLGDLAPAQAVAAAATTLPVIALVVVLSRLYPLLAVTTALIASSWMYSLSVLLFVVAYLAGLRMPGVRRALVFFGAGVALCAAAALLLLGAAAPVAWMTLATSLALNIGLPWMVGAYRRQHRALATAGWEHARQLQREHALTADRARLRERSRIAQDMHDSLGHELSLIALRAGALEVAPDLDDGHRRSAAELRATAVTATRHLRDVIGVLRTDAEPPPTVPADEGVAALVDRVRDSGMRVTLVREDPVAGLVPLVDRAVHRIVQESLTNAAKYAPGAEATVWITSDGERLEARVVNSAPPRGRPATAAGGRLGLIGLRERVRVVGGAFAAGPDGDGGWEVCATMPLDGSPGAGPEASDDPADEIDLLQSAARRRVRRWTLALVLVPIATVAAAALSLGWAALDVLEEDSLTPQGFDSLAIGDSRTSLDRALPSEVNPRTMGLEPSTAPTGASCAYYRGAEGVLGAGALYYRLCFADGVLVTKEEVRTR